MFLFVCLFFRSQWSPGAELGPWAPGAKVSPE